MGQHLIVYTTLLFGIYTGLENIWLIEKREKEAVIGNVYQCSTPEAIITMCKGRM